jgi:hypothetical protein
VAGKTYIQVERLAWRAALAVAPDVAERRRAKAERERARVTVFREESGAVGLSGRDLPAAQALAGHASVLARAREYEASGAFPGQSTSGLEALAYLHLLNGVSAADAIAFARTAGAEPPDGGSPDGEGPDGGDEDPGDDGDPGGPGTDGGGDGPRGAAGGRSSATGDGDSHGDYQEDDDGDEDQGPGGDDGRGGPGPDSGGDDDPGGGAGNRTVLPEVTVPLVTLQGRAARAGENRLLGPLDPALARDLAAAAARSPYSRWEVTVVDDRGYATGHGTARPGRGSPPQPRAPGPGGCALPARINVTVTETRLRQLAAQAAEPRPGAPHGSAAPPGDWELLPRAAGTWALTLPGGRELTVRFDVVPTHECDHRHEVSTYQPGGRLRRLVQVRDQECTFPTCSRPARDCDFEHAVPYDQGGKTDACNAGARSRRCHQVKQSKGWTVTQPKPGWHTWTTPTGRTYTQEPWRYIA